MTTKEKEEISDSEDNDTSDSEADPLKSSTFVDESSTSSDGSSAEEVFR